MEPSKILQMFEGVPTFLTPLKKIRIKFNGEDFDSQEHAYWCSVVEPELKSALKRIRDTKDLRCLGQRLCPHVHEKEEIILRRAIFEEMVLQHEPIRRMFISSKPNEYLKEVFYRVKDIPFSQLEIFDENAGHLKIEA